MSAAKNLASKFMREVVLSLDISKPHRDAESS